VPDAAEIPRDVAWEGCYNARDLGGLPVVGGGCIRRGALVRSDNLSRLTPAGVAALGASGVRTVLDVRSRYELSLEPHPFLGYTGRGDVRSRPTAAWKPVVSPPAYVLGVLDELRRRHGEIDGFLRACGVDVALARRVRERLVE